MAEVKRDLSQLKADARNVEAEYTEAIAKTADPRSKLKRKNDERENLGREIESQHRQIDYQQGRKDTGQYELEDNLRVWDNLHKAKSQRDKELAPLFDFDTDREERPRIDESTLSEPTKAYLARLDADIQAEEDKWLKDQ